MKTLILALLLTLGLYFTPTRAAEPAPDLQNVATLSGADFAARAKKLEEIGEWQSLLEGGHAWREAHPDEAAGWLAEGLGAYARGDAKTAIASWEKAIKIDPSVDVKYRLGVAREIVRLYPDLQLKPLEIVNSDGALEAQPWSEKADSLLAAKDYDGIERVARELQKSNAGTILGAPFLATFFDALAEPGENYQVKGSAIAAWRAARPASDLARLAEIDYWINVGFGARGTGFANSITPKMQQEVDGALEKATQGIAALPASANGSPLTFEVLQNWGLLSGVGRGFLDSVYTEGQAKFPEFMTIYFGRTNILLRRWYGQDGELEATIKARADQIGGVEGDVFYARAVVNFTRGYSELANEAPYDIARVWRGLDALIARKPDSVSVRNARLLEARIEAYSRTRNRDYERMKSELFAPNGNLIPTGSLLTYPESLKQLAETRLGILAVPPK